MPSVSAYLAVAAGGALGAALRFAVVNAAMRAAPGFPWGTMAVNIAGSVAMGVLAALLLERSGGALGRAAPFVITGVLGGFTTFSAFSLDVVALIERGRGLLAAGYALGSVALAIGGLWAGLRLGRALWGAP